MESLRARNKHLEATNAAVRHESRAKGNVPLKPGQSPKEAELEERVAKLENENAMLLSEVDCIDMLNGQIGQLQGERDLLQGELGKARKELDRVLGVQ